MYPHLSRYPSPVQVPLIYLCTLTCPGTPHLSMYPHLSRYPHLSMYPSPVQVCSEETMAEILQRYLRYNSHACSYTWKHGGETLDMSRTLSENNILDDDHKLQHLRLDRDLFTPALLLHFNDDLTRADL
uniref:Uncharacterized protein n=1 Tax=Cyclopterus lumpus TaxID=8103 RepID=A0A8C2WYL6_CYCLU